MRALFMPSVWLGLVAAGSIACGATDENVFEAPAAQSAVQPIIDGTVDNAAANNAVVQLSSGGGRCTGTVFLKTGGATYILTAAHCVPANSVDVGPDSDDPIASYSVDAYQPDDRYGDGEGLFSLNYDIAIVRVPTVIPNVTPIELVGATDGLTTNATVTSYGYGSTVGYGSGVPNSQRHLIARNIAQLTRESIVYNQSDERGICAGDSGGPVVHGDGAARRVVGVHSTVGNQPGQERCFGQANSVRVSARRDFIDAVLNGTALPQLTSCQTCLEAGGGSVCNQKRQRCENDAECNGLVDCFRQGGSVNACVDAHPEGLGPYLDYADCSCSDTCAEQCSGQTECAEVSKCGVSYTRVSYNTCIEENCCAEADAAAADGVGYICLGDPEADGCASNAKYQAFSACTDQHCARSKPGSSSGGSSSSSGEPEEEEPLEEEEPAEEEPAPKKKKKVVDEGGCAVAEPGQSGPGSAPAAILFALGAVAMVRARRRRA